MESDTKLVRGKACKSSPTSFFCFTSERLRLSLSGSVENTQVRIRTQFWGAGVHKFWLSLLNCEKFQSITLIIEYCISQESLNSDEAISSSKISSLNIRDIRFCSHNIHCRCQQLFQVGDLHAVTQSHSQQVLQHPNCSHLQYVSFLVAATGKD